MRLMIGERLVLLSTIPQEGNFLTLKLLRELREKLVPTEQEQEVLKIREQVDEEGNRKGIMWDIPADPQLLFADIAISPKEHRLCADALEGLNQKNKLTEQHFSLYEKFCATPDKEN